MRFLTALLVVTALAASLGAVELEPIPEPGLEGVEEAVRSELRRAREAVSSLLTDDGHSPDLAEAFGALGRLYLRYDLLEAAAAAFGNAAVLDPGELSWEYYLGVVANERWDLPTAHRHLLRAHRLAERDLPTILRLGQVALDRNAPEEAETWFERALELDPESAKARHGLAQIALARGEPRRAVELFEAVLAAQPEASTVRYQLGLAYRELGDAEAARRELGLRGPGEVTFDDPSMEEVERLTVGAGAYLVQGNIAFSRGMFEVAAGLYRRALSEDPGNTRALRALASALAEGGRLDEALSTYARVLERLPDDPIARYNVGTIHLEKRDPERAIPHLQVAVDTSPDYTHARFNLASALAAVGRSSEALEEIRRVVEAEPRDAEPRLLLARLLLDLGRSGEAREELEGLVASRPDLVEAAMALSDARSAAGDPEGAMHALERAIEAAPESLEPRRKRAVLLGRLGRLGEAAQAFGEIAAREPLDEEAHFGRGMALLMAGEELAARRAFEEGIGALPSSLALRHALARVLAAATDPAARDGARAHELATAVFRERPTPAHGETVAMALAELGRFDEAAAWQRRVLAEAERGGAGEELADLRRRLAAYEAGSPVRAPWAGVSRRR